MELALDEGAVGGRVAGHEADAARLGGELVVEKGEEPAHGRRGLDERHPVAALGQHQGRLHPGGAAAHHESRILSRGFRHLNSPEGSVRCFFHHFSRPSHWKASPRSSVT